MSDISQTVATDRAAPLDDVCRLLAQVCDLLEAQVRPAVELLTRDDMAALLNVGVSTFDRLKAAGRIGPRSLELAGVKYSTSEVKAWLSNRAPDGELYDATNWPAVWAALQARGKNR